MGEPSRPWSNRGYTVDGQLGSKFASAVARARRLARMSSSRWSAWRKRAVRRVKSMPRPVLVAVLTIALVATGGAVATAGGAPLSFSGIGDWFGSLFTDENVGPTSPPVTQTSIPDDDTGELGREKFFQYASQPSGAGSQMLVNLHTG